MEEANEWMIISRIATTDRETRWPSEVALQKECELVTYIRKMIVSNNNLSTDVTRHGMTTWTRHLVALSHCQT